MEFQRWWVLKSKLFAQESTCSKEILISTSLNHLWFSVDGVIKVDYLEFPCEKFEILCELDVDADADGNGDDDGDGGEEGVTRKRRAISLGLMRGQIFRLD